MQKILLLLLITFSLVYSKEIEVTSLMSGLYSDSSNHFKEYKSDLIKKEQAYDKGINATLKYDTNYMYNIAGKSNYKTSMITKIYPKNNMFEFNIDSTVLKFIIDVSNKNHSKNATITLYDPNGKLVVNDIKNHVKVNDIHAASTIEVSAPIYGKWKMVFDKNSDIEGSISVVSPIYLFGFSFTKTVWGREGLMEIDRKKPRAIIGSRSEVSLASYKLYDKNSIKVKFVDVYKGKEQSLKIKAINNNDIYLQRSSPKYKTFYIYIEGKDINGYQFTRMSKRPY